MNLLLPPQGIGEGWGGVKNLRLLQELLYTNFFQIEQVRLFPILPRTIENRSTRKCDRILILLQPQLQHFQVGLAGRQFVH